MHRQLQVKDKIESDKIIKVSPFKKDIRKTTPHKHNNYFEIIYLSAGSGHHFIDSRKYEIQPPVMYFIRKEQVHYWEPDTEPDGFVVIIKKSFIEKSLDNKMHAFFSKISRHSHTAYLSSYRMLNCRNSAVGDVALLLQQKNPKRINLFKYST